MSGYMTRQRQLLYTFLSDNADRRFTAQEAANALSGEGISLSAVYRNLSALERDGYITRTVSKKSRESLYQYTHSEGCRDRIHLTCTACGGSFHMDSDEADRLQKNMAESMGFEINRSRTVLYGICGKCGRERR